MADPNRAQKERAASEQGTFCTVLDRGGERTEFRMASAASLQPSLAPVPLAIRCFAIGAQGVREPLEPFPVVRFLPWPKHSPPACALKNLTFREESTEWSQTLNTSNWTLRQMRI